MAKNIASAGHQAFHQAVKNYDMAAVRTMLANGISPEVIVEELTPLFVAADSGHPGMVELLLQAGANPNRRMVGTGAAQRRTALNAAADLGDLGSVEKLLAAGANPCSTDSKNRTAAHLLLGSNRFGTESRFASACDAWKYQLHGALNCMLDRGVGINQPDENGLTLLHLAVCERAPALIIDMLLRRGADPHRMDIGGLAPVHYACTGKRVEQYDFLGKRGVDMNFLTVEGSHALHHCDSSENLNRVLATKPDLERRNHAGRTALAEALHDIGSAQWKGKPIHLIAAGASLDTPDHDGVTPRALIKRKRLTEVAAFVSAHEAKNAMARVAVASKAGPFARARMA